MSKLAIISKIASLLLLLLLLPFASFHIGDGLSSVDNYQSTEILMVLGAGVNSNGTPSEVLRKRLDKAVELYAHNPGSIILVTGDNRVDHYNEPEAMQRYLVSQGIPVASVVQDYAGRRTLDSCWRARNVFKAKDITIVTQAFHMPRSVFLCRSVGLQTRSAIAQDGGFETRLRGVVREVPSSVLAVGQVLLGWRAEIAGDGSELDLSRV